jgi:phosphatidylglycerophosphatase A
VRRAVLSAFGIGFLPGPSGTYASAAVAAACLLLLEAAVPLPLSAGAFAALGVGTTLALAAPRETDAVAGGGKHGDPRWVVSDEVAGQGLAALGALGARSPLLAVATSFVLFRALDIGKPGPVARLERLPGALGVLADDGLSGVLAGLATAAAVAFAGM